MLFDHQVVKISRILRSYLRYYHAFTLFLEKLLGYPFLIAILYFVFVYFDSYFPPKSMVLHLYLIMALKFVLKQLNVLCLTESVAVRYEFEVIVCDCYCL